MTTPTFDHLFVLGRPASGKSEFLDFMRKLPDEERAERFHVGRMVEIDDFPWLWEKFLEDDLWEQVTGKRLHSYRIGNLYGNTPEIFRFLIEKLRAEIERRYSPDESFYRDSTLLIEFSRGGECPYAQALSRFPPEIYRRAAILYVEVSGNESMRRNDARYKEKLKHTVLAHKCPDEIMERFYKEDDWPALTDSRREGLLTLAEVPVPFVTMHNEPESTDPAVLTPRYGAALTQLWKLAQRT
jgi:hypothetical protein